MAINGWNENLISKNNASSLSHLGEWYWGLLLLLLMLVIEMITEQGKVPEAEGKAIGFHVSFFSFHFPFHGMTAFRLICHFRPWSRYFTYSILPIAIRGPPLCYPYLIGSRHTGTGIMYPARCTRVALCYPLLVLIIISSLAGTLGVAQRHTPRSESRPYGRTLIIKYLFYELLFLSYTLLQLEITNHLDRGSTLTRMLRLLLYHSFTDPEEATGQAGLLDR